MSLTLRTLTTFQQKSVNTAAALAKEQLSYAKQIVEESNLESPHNTELVAAVLQAISTNYLAHITHGKD